MGEAQLTRCVSPTISARNWSTYTVLGFVGYVVASAVGAALAMRWNLALGERLVALIAPPSAFIVVITLATAIKGREWIVFYQALFAAVGAVVVAALLTHGRLWRELDVTVVGIGTFLVFGRIGCFQVACCHGRPSRRGVVYGAAHVTAGFWPRWEGRRLFPIQLVEAAGAGVLVVGAFVASTEPGAATIVFGTGYAVMRFALELFRGDVLRPYARGVSEAQWCCLATIVICALAWPRWWTLAACLCVFIWAAVLVSRRPARELFLPPHVLELDRACAVVAADPDHARRETSLGVGISCHRLPDGRIDWILSAPHPAWSTAAAERLARDLWPAFEIVAGRAPGVVHVLVAAPAAAP